MTVNFFSTTVNPNLKKKISNLLKNGFISSGKKSDEFEKKFAKKFNLNNCTAVNSGTSSLHLALKCLNIQKDDEVIIPAQTFIATGLVVLYCNAKPVFADIQKNTGNICPLSIKKKISKRTKAIIVVHWGGYPCDLDEIKLIAKKKKIAIIEDAAHALGASYKGNPIGSISDFTCFSFQATKHLTTGDGGILVCKKKKHHVLAQKLKWFGIDRNKKKEFQGERIYNLKNIGYKYHLNDIASLIGIENLKIIKKKLSKLKELAKFYDKELKNIEGIEVLENQPNINSSYWLYTIIVKNRTKFFNIMKEKKIPVSLVHRRIDRHKIFGGVNKNLKGQFFFDKHHICLPINENVTYDYIKKLTTVIKKFY